MDELIKRLRSAVCTYPQMSEDEPGGYCTEQDQLLDEAATALEQAAKDAERYRWLQEHTAATGLAKWMGDVQFLDAAIDAAIAAANK